MSEKTISRSVWISPVTRSMPTSTSHTGGSPIPRPAALNSSRHCPSLLAPPNANGRRASPFSNSAVCSFAVRDLFRQEDASRVDAAEVEAQIARPVVGNGEARLDVPFRVEGAVDHAG